jgi:hypothetical protein
MRFVALFLLIYALLAASASAVTIVPLTFEQLVNQSAAVVLGRVVDVRGDFTDDRRAIQSVVTVEVLRGIKGRSGETLAFTVPGGQAGRYLNVIPGAPVFARGDLAVFFVSSRGARLPVTTGFTQGIFRVQRGATNQMVVWQKAPVPLTVFEANIRAIVDAAR